MLPIASFVLSTALFTSADALSLENATPCAKAGNKANFPRTSTDTFQVVNNKELMSSAAPQGPCTLCCCRSWSSGVAGGAGAEIRRVRFRRIRFCWRPRSVLAHITDATDLSRVVEARVLLRYSC
ncbi:unnamed protein product [Rhizoctonia solani]|uniref:Secreted protein n=1 Tax=Rhizoctonia solani TaxID=456999 RepID=A0A8H3H361_9AGAM|nr:unnamed protein product [Rhizoctonia solani]